MLQSIMEALPEVVLEAVLEALPEAPKQVSLKKVERNEGKLKENGQVENINL